MRLFLFKYAKVAPKEINNDRFQVTTSTTTIPSTTTQPRTALNTDKTYKNNKKEHQ